MRRYTENGSAVVIGSRIALLRSQNNITQKKLAEALSELSPSSKSLMLISHWENGRRVPDSDTITLIANYFGVTEEYIRGLTDDPKSTEIKDRNINIKLKPEDLNHFDGKVVYLAFEDYEHEDQPAIVNLQKEYFVVKDGKINFTNPAIRAVYISEPDYMHYKSINGMSPLDMATLLKLKNKFIWVEMKSPDAIVRKRYNGWYRKNEREDCLINEDGYVLPLEGLNISYYAYAGRDEMRKPSNQ